MQERAQDLVGSARVDIVGTEQEITLGCATVFAHQVLDRGNRLLVRRGTGVEHVRRHLFAFVLHRVEQQAVEFLEYRQHRFARHRGPATEHHGDLVLGQQLSTLFREQRPVGRRVDHHRLKHLAVDPALGVDLIDGHQGHVLERRFRNRHGPRQRMQDADLDGLGSLKGPGHAHGGNRCRQRESLDQTTTLHCAISMYVECSCGQMATTEGSLARAVPKCTRGSGAGGCGQVEVVGAHQIRAGQRAGCSRARCTGARCS
ncbi:hypothetical protein D9M71_393500 [compost metagenome]